MEHASDRYASHYAKRLAALRAQMASRRLDIFIVPHANRYCTEMIAPPDRRLEWLTGFDGSAGTALVSADKAAIFVDGRYTEQLRGQVDGTLYSFEHLLRPGWPDWLVRHIAPDMRIGWDPACHTIVEARRIAQLCKEHGCSSVPVPDNPVDAIWTDRPAPPNGAIFLHDLSIAGVAADKKIAQIQKELAARGALGLLLTRPEHIAWLLNIRGQDIDFTPLAFCTLVLPARGLPTLCIAPGKVPGDVRKALAPFCRIEEEGQVIQWCRAIVEEGGKSNGAAGGKSSGATGGAIMLDPVHMAAIYEIQLKSAGIPFMEAPDPVALPMAIKGAAEISGTIAAHRRDGLALVRFLSWLDETGRNGTVDELGAVHKLTQLRARGEKYRGPAFDAISASGANGAIIHYRVNERSNQPLAHNATFLIDSGAQYDDGTTDVTRTIAIGTPEDEMIRHFTLVLKGHVALARACFPRGTSGARLDALARQFLWGDQLDFDHGTGHGVGVFMNVHEGPQRITKSGDVALQPGMIVSNEPGYYAPGRYGIRIENLLLVTPADGPDSSYLRFEPLTMAPLDRRLMDTELLGAHDIAWVDAYHARVNETISPMLDDTDADVAVRQWLRAATRPLA